MMHFHTDASTLIKHFTFQAEFIDADQLNWTIADYTQKLSSHQDGSNQKKKRKWIALPISSTFHSLFREYTPIWK